jgi:hypothetical protein
VYAETRRAEMNETRDAELEVVLKAKLNVTLSQIAHLEKEYTHARAD